MTNCATYGKATIIHVIVGLIKKTLYKMSQYIPNSFRNSATKIDLKNVTHVDTSGFALKINSASLKTEFDKLEIDKLVPVPVGLSKLSDVVKNGVAKKTVYDELVAKVNNIHTSRFALKTKYQTDETELEKKVLM